MSPRDRPSSLRERVARGLSWSFVQTWASHAITFVVFLVIARLLGPAEFGTVALAYVVLGGLVALVDLGLCDAIIRLRHAGQAHFDAAFWSISAFAVALFVLVVMLAAPLARAFDQPPLGSLLWVVAIALPIAAAGLVPAAILRRGMRFKELALRTLIATSAGGAVGIGLAAAGYGYWSLVAKGLTDASMATLLVWRASPYRPTLSFDRAAWLELFATARHLLASRAIEIAAQRADAVIVSGYLGPAALGLYTAGQRIHRSMMDAFYTTVQRVALPAFSEIAADRPRTQHALLRVARTASFFTFPLFAFTAALAVPLVTLLFGERWAAAAPVLAWYSAAGVLFSVSYFNAPLMVAAGRTELVLILTVANTSVNVAGFLIGVQWGIAGVAAAYAIRGYLLLPMNLLFLKRSIGLSPWAYVRNLIPNFTTTLLSVAAVMAVASLLPPSMTPVSRLPILAAVALMTQCVLSITLSRRETLQMLGDALQMTQTYPRVARAVERCQRALRRVGP